LFRAEGVDVQVVEFSTLGDCRRAYERGQLDACGATVAEVLTARDHSPRSPQIVHVMDYSDGADVIVARPGITDCAGLKGRRVGVELSTVGVYVLARALEKHGLSLSDVTAVPLNTPAMEHAMRNGELDAVVVYPPHSVALLRDGEAATIFSSAEIPGEVVDVLAVDAEITRTRPDAVAKLLRAFWRAVAYAEQNPEEAYAVMAAREGLTPAEFQRALTVGLKTVSQADQASYLRPGGKLAAVIDASDRILRQTGQIKGADRRGDAMNGSFAEGQQHR
jgi:NitT/TauT family transport system substrate-binding protein